MLPAAVAAKKVSAQEQLRVLEDNLKAAENSKIPKNIAEAKLALGLWYKQNHPVQSFEQAKSYFTEVISANINPKLTAEAQYSRAMLLEENADLKTAEEDYKQACSLIEKEIANENNIKNLEENAKFFFDYGRMLVDQERFADAISYLKTAKQFSPITRNISLLIGAINKVHNPKNIVECLQIVGLNLDEMNEFIRVRRWPPLWVEATRIGALELLKYMVTQKTDTAVMDDDGNTALHVAAAENQVHLIEFLSLHIDRNARNKVGLTPVMVAAQRGHVAMVLALLAFQGVNVSTEKENVLSVAIGAGQGCVLESIVQDKTLLKRVLEYINVTQLFFKAIDADQKVSLAMLQLLIQFFPDKLNASYENTSPLHYAIKRGHNEAVYCLVQEGANLEQPSAGAVLELAKKHAPNLVNFLKNVIPDVQQKTQELGKQKLEFINKLIEKLKSKLPDLFNTAYQQTKNSNRVLECLLQLFNITEFDKIFAKRGSELLILENAILNDLVKNKNTITARSMSHTTLKFDQKKLETRLKELLDSDWHTQEVLSSPEKTSQKTVESKERFESRKLSIMANHFCECFEKQFDEAYGDLRGIANGKVVDIKTLRDQEKITGLASMASNIPNFSVASIPIPVGAVATGIVQIIQYFRTKFKKEQAERMTRFFKGITPHQRTGFIRYVSEQLAQKYWHQIHHLAPGPDGIEQFADCLVVRVLDYIISDEANLIASQEGVISGVFSSIQSWVLNQEIPREQIEYKSKFDVIMEGILRVTTKFPKEQDPLQTINGLTAGDGWTVEGLVGNSGVIVAGQRYASDKCLLKRYGYTLFGTQAEVDRRGLSLGPRKGETWGEGRIWEEFVEMQMMSAPSLGQATYVPGYQSVQANAGANDSQVKPDEKAEQERLYLRGLAKKKSS